MTWKAYAAVSGATVLAGWLASSPPANAPTGTTSPARSPRAQDASASSDIQAQAERLRTGLQVERNYAAPQRNPFRFEQQRDVDLQALDVVGDHPEDRRYDEHREQDHWSSLRLVSTSVSMWLNSRLM